MNNKRTELKATPAAFSSSMRFEFDTENDLRELQAWLLLIDSNCSIKNEGIFERWPSAANISSAEFWFHANMIFIA